MLDESAFKTVSPYNFVADIKPINTAFEFQDVTLREGEQASDVSFTLSDKINLAQELAELGIKRIQIGYSPVHAEELKKIKARVPSDVSLSLIVVSWKNNWQQAIQAAAESGADRLQILMRSAGRQLYKIGYTPEQALERAQQVLKFAKSSGVKNIGLELSFATLATWETLEAFIRTAKEEDVKEMGFADSSGVISPDGVYHLYSRLCQSGLKIGGHFHNDFGLATANSVAAIKAGCSWIDISGNGLGERAGNSSFAEVVATLEFLYKTSTGIELSRLKKYSEMIVELTRVPHMPRAPIVGDLTFSQQLDMHVEITRQDPSLLEPFNPYIVGNRRTLHIGKGSGPVAVEQKLQELGFDQVDRQLLEKIVAEVNRIADIQKKEVSDEQLADLVR